MDETYEDDTEFAEFDVDREPLDLWELQFDTRAEADGER